MDISNQGIRRVNDNYVRSCTRCGAEMTFVKLRKAQRTPLCRYCRAKVSEATLKHLSEFARKHLPKS